MWRVPINDWIDWHDSLWVNSRMAIMVMTDNMDHIYGVRNAGMLVKSARIVPKVWIIYDALAVAFEMQMINAVKTNKRWE